MRKHAEKCKGQINMLECEYCHTMYSSRQGKCNHLRICPVKKEAESKALVVSQQPGQLASSVTNNNTTNNTTNNNTNMTVNGDNITNNNNITQNIIVFERNEAMLYDHISKQCLENILRSPDHGQLLTAFSEEVLKRKENQCVRKTNLRSTSSAVHVGNDVWEARADKQVLPQLLCNLAMSFAGSMDDYNIALQQAVYEFMQDVTCFGEHGNDDEEEIAQMQRLYKSAMNNIKHILFNITKQRKGERKAQAMLES